MLHRSPSKRRTAAAFCLAVLICCCASAAQAKTHHSRRASRAKAAPQAAARAAAASGTYDVLYGWRPDQAGANSLKYRVAHVLGPDISKRLRVVQAGGRYAVIYPRHGGLSSAENVVKSHTRMLAAKGMPAPSAVRSQDLDAAPAQTAAAPQPAAQAAAPQARAAEAVSLALG